MSRSKPVYDMFARQFTRKGKSYIYRKNLRGAPIRVTEAERDTFIAGFRRHYRMLNAAVIVAVLLTMALAIAFGGLGNGADPAIVGFGVVGIAILFIGGIFWAVHRIFDAPAQALARRSAEGEAMTRDEARKMVFDSLSYGMLAGVAALGFGIVAFQAMGHDVWHGWGRLFWLPAVILPGLAAVQALRKWRFERS